MTSFSPRHSRRSVLTMAALGGLALAGTTRSARAAPGAGTAHDVGAAQGTGAAPTSRVATAFDPGAPENLLATLMRMRAALDDRLVIGYMEGRYYGVVEDEMTPLYGFVSATFARHRPTPVGGYEFFSSEVAFFTDLDTHEAMQTWHNPYTDQTVEVRQPEMPPTRILLDKDLNFTLPEPRPGFILRHRVYPTDGVGDDFWLIEESITTAQIPGQAKPFRYGEIVTLRSRKSDLQVPGTPRVPCHTSYESVVSWRPWLKMGDHPGHLTAAGSGGYDIHLDQMPATFLRALASHRPELLKDPASSIAALWAQR